MGLFSSIATAINPIGAATAAGLSSLGRGGSSGGGGGAAPSYGPGASQADAIRQLYQQHLGRPASDQEVNYLDEFVKQGHLTPFEVGQVIQGLPEYQNKQLQNYGQQYSQALGANDQTVLDRAQQSLTGDFAQMGRPSSSGYVGAFAQAAQNLAMQRQQSLANFYGGGYQNIMGNQVSQGNQTQDYGRNRAQEDRARNYGVSDYYTQQNDFNNYLRGQQTRNMQGAIVNGGVGLLTSGVGGYFQGQALAGRQQAPVAPQGQGPYRSGYSFGQ